MKHFATRQAAMVITKDLDGLTVKRIAWAFGCAKKDSDEEVELYRLLLAKIERLKEQR